MSYKELNTVTPNLVIELNFSCPHCNEYVDVLRESYRLNDEAFILDQLTPTDGTCWIDAHEKFKEQIDCPICNKPVLLKGVEW